MRIGPQAIVQGPALQQFQREEREAVGLVDSRLEVVEDWQEPNRKGVITYVEDGKPRGVLLWNVWDKLDDARELIRSGEGALAV